MDIQRADIAAGGVLANNLGFESANISGASTSIAAQFLARLDDIDPAERRRQFRALPEEIRRACFDLDRARCFVPENADVSKRTEHRSLSGAYTLAVTPFSSPQDFWVHTQGLVYETASRRLVAEIQRNASPFPFTFIENHSNGHFYLICGADSEGQTVIELDTGKRRDHMPEALTQRFGWAMHSLDRPSSTLVASGCGFAATSEFKFYDFSNPMAGWPELKLPAPITQDHIWPEFREDGTIVCRHINRGRGPALAARTFRREGYELKLIGEA